jgi:hypothetical protein
MAKRVFISYRREDTASAAGRIYDRLRDHFRPASVFIDVSTIRGGEKFEQKTLAEIGRSDTALVFIGKRWMEPSPGTIRARLWENGDYVRKEVQAILSREMLVLPILVDGAAMPAADLLPEGVRPLVARNALPLRHDRFDDDSDNIFAAIFGLSIGTKRSTKKKLIVKLVYAVLGAMIGLAVLVGAAMLHEEIMARPISASIGSTLTLLLLIACTVLGAALGLRYATRGERRY